VRAALKQGMSVLIDPIRNEHLQRGVVGVMGGRDRGDHQIQKIRAMAQVLPNSGLGVEQEVRELKFLCWEKAKNCLI